VLANRLKEAEFAADLSAVDSGEATDDYATPEGFFRITFMTEGLKRVLTLALQRLAATGGGDPVIGLQTSFGGGKTHTMLALYHRSRARDLARLEGVGPLAEAAGITSWQPAKVAVFVGTAKGADMSLNLRHGPPVRTLWGYLAWRLAGDEGLKIVADAEAARTNPGSEAMVEVLKRAGPSIILFDELVAYARQLDDDRFEAFLSFIQSLTEAVKIVPNVMLVGSLPESQAEAGGARGVAALMRLERVFGRIQSAWQPAGGDETYEIIRRRLFQKLEGAEAERAREETVKAFHAMYRSNAAEFPPAAKEARYLELLRLSYPIHPELFVRLSRDWASLGKFQRTRGVLKMMANVVGVLWSQRVPDPLIMPARVPLAHDRIRASVLYPLDPGFGAVLQGEVDGEGSLPAQIEANPNRRISKARAATRAARSVFLCSAPIVGQPNAGLDIPGLRLACAEPGDQLEIFGEAVGELASRATFLYEEGRRFWFATKPTLNRLADEKARAFLGPDVDAEIVDTLTQESAQKGGFHRVFPAPADPITIDEATAASLVILHPASPHAGRVTSGTRATDAIADALTRCRSAQRRFRNTLFFAAPDEAQLEVAREAMRRAMAWRDIVADKALQAQLTQGQAQDAGEKARTARDGALRAVRSAWSHIFYPDKTPATPPGMAFELERLGINTAERAGLPRAIFDKLKAEGAIRERFGPDTFILEIGKLWPDDRPHLAVSEIAEWFQSYVYLPKLRDRVVLDLAVREALAKLDTAYAFASGYDAASGSYQGLALAAVPPDPLPASTLLVRREVALRHLTPAPSGPPDPTEPAPTGEPAPTEPGAPAPAGPRRFFGSVEIDMVRPIKSFETILQSVVAELQRTPQSKVRITLEIDAEAPGGFAAEDVGVVRDNATQLKFDPHSTGFDR
jgi:hypothetical protein